MAFYVTDTYYAMHTGRVLYWLILWLCYIPPLNRPRLKMRSSLAKTSLLEYEFFCFFYFFLDVLWCIGENYQCMHLSMYSLRYHWTPRAREGNLVAITLLVKPVVNRFDDIIWKINCLTEKYKCVINYQFVANSFTPSHLKLLSLCIHTWYSGGTTMDESYNWCVNTMDGPTRLHHIYYSSTRLRVLELLE